MPAKDIGDATTATRATRIRARKRGLPIPKRRPGGPHKEHNNTTRATSARLINADEQTRRIEERRAWITMRGKAISWVCRSLANMELARDSADLARGFSVLKDVRALLDDCPADVGSDIADTMTPSELDTFLDRLDADYDAMMDSGGPSAVAQNDTDSPPKAP